MTIFLYFLLSEKEKKEVSWRLFILVAFSSVKVKA